MSLSDWQALLLEPQPLEVSADYVAWFDAIARRLLCGCRLIAGGESFRLTEIEIYYHGGTHCDPFNHCDPIQKSTGGWYFHRSHGVFRGGSFKGIDLTFGGPETLGGALFRGMEREDGTLVDGPSLCVDLLLARTGQPSVDRLFKAIAGRPAWNPANPLYLQWLPELENRPILKTARVGLSMRRLRESEVHPRFILLPYRYLTESRRIRKGKLHMVLALYAQGLSPTEIRDLTGCTKSATERWIRDYEQGGLQSDFAAYFGIELGSRELARMHGLWQMVSR